MSLFCYALVRVHFSFAIIFKRKRKLVALLLLSNRCIVTIKVLWLFLTVPWVGIQCVIVLFSDHTCADPESFAKGGPTLTIFFDEGKEDPSSTKSGPPSARQQNPI